MQWTLSVLFIVFSCFAISNSQADWKLLNSVSHLERIQQAGVLTVLSRYSPTTVYKTQNGYAGLEYDLVNLFAEQLGVKVRYIFPQKFDQILTDISNGVADLAAAGLTITEKRKQTMRFSPSYHNVTEQLIYHSRSKRPNTFNDLKNGILEVVFGTSHVDSLKKQRAQYPSLRWNTNTTLDTQELLYLLNTGLIDYTLTDSNQINQLRRFYPRLRIAFDVGKPKPLAWALAKTNDISLYNEVIRFFSKIKTDGTLEQLLERHYGHTLNLDNLEICRFREHIHNRLPEYLALFQQAAKKYQLDWRLLAAISYQESHWLEHAISPTGVKGLMMLTRGTAKYLGVSNRTDPEQSIYGGALYFFQRLKKIPDRIKEPDKTWMALAAYNVGYGHLEDARILAQQSGDNPDKWIDIKKYLPLLSKKKWYTKTKHGYARGYEPVRYVENVRSYFDLLAWNTEGDNIGKAVMAVKPNPPIKPNKALKINNPAI